MAAPKPVKEPEKAPVKAVDLTKIRIEPEDVKAPTAATTARRESPGGEHSPYSGTATTRPETGPGGQRGRKSRAKTG